MSTRYKTSSSLDDNMGALACACLTVAGSNATYAFLLVLFHFFFLGFLRDLYRYFPSTDGSDSVLSDDSESKEEELLELSSDEGSSPSSFVE